MTRTSMRGQLSPLVERVVDSPPYSLKLSVFSSTILQPLLDGVSALSPWAFSSVPCVVTLRRSSVVVAPLAKPRIRLSAVISFS